MLPSSQLYGHGNGQVRIVSADRGPLARFADKPDAVVGERGARREGCGDGVGVGQ